MTAASVPAAAPAASAQAALATTTPASQPDRRDRLARPGRVVGHGTLLAAIAVTLTLVIVAPIALSSGDLIAWARAPQGLGLDGAWPLVVFVALDAAAAVCVLFVIYSAWRGEATGIFGLLVWAFAGGSALANYRHGQATPARDDAVFFACMSLAGPILLHATLHRVRRWVRTSAGEYHPARAHFGLRWVPGVAFAETLEAWKAAVRSGIDRPEVAIAFVRERRLLADLAAADPDGAGEAIGYAAGALAEAGMSFSAHTVRTWLAERGVLVDSATLAGALSELPDATPSSVSDRGGPRPSSRAALAAPAPKPDNGRSKLRPAGDPVTPSAHAGAHASAHAGAHRGIPATTRQIAARGARARDGAWPPRLDGRYAERYAQVKALYLDGVHVAEQIARGLGLPPSTTRRLLAAVKRDLAGLNHQPSEHEPSAHHDIAPSLSGVSALGSDGEQPGLPSDAGDRAPGDRGERSMGASRNRSAAPARASGR
jgi:hypothetical protein